ncbi:MAG: hypothetical protein ACI4WH_01230 [Oscillospiraceae bacterium]
MKFEYAPFNNENLEDLIKHLKPNKYHLPNIRMFGVTNNDNLLIVPYRVFPWGDKYDYYYLVSLNGEVSIAKYKFKSVVDIRHFWSEGYRPLLFSIKDLDGNDLDINLYGKSTNLVNNAVKFEIYNRENLKTLLGSKKYQEMLDFNDRIVNTYFYEYIDEIHSYNLRWTI